MDIRPLNEHRCELGESPLWHPIEQALYSVDIARREVLRWHASGVERWAQDSEPSCLALRAQGGLLLARRDGLFAFDAGRLQQLAEPPYDPSKQRFNDGKVGPDGAWYVGTIDDARAPEAALYRCGPAGITRLQQGITTSNGLAWSPNGGSMYWADTKAHTVYRLAANGEGPREVFAQWQQRDPAQPLDAYAGRPDGAAVDAEGCYWVAMYEGARLLRLSPYGDLLLTVMLPARCPTMPCFGGADLRTLYITTAAEAAATALPAAGALLSLRVDVPGLPPAFASW
ncbi:MAG: SMP-30/gluconolactonase/LRE family protein [Inhella sp.]